MKIEFEYEGTWITDPYLDETGRFEVKPKVYYGKVYLNKLKEFDKWLSKLAKNNGVTKY